MKQKIFTILMALVLISCQKEEGGDKNAAANLTSFKNEWLNSKLDSVISKSDKNTVCYLFAKEELVQLLENEQLNKFRFVLGFTESRLDLRTVGVNGDGMQLGMINSTIIEDENFDSQINSLSSSAIQFRSDDEIISKHILNPETAYAYINKWNIILAGNGDLNDVISYDNMRINHFSIEREVMDNLSHLPNFKYLGVVLGVNPEGKLTTVMLGLNENRSIIFSANEGVNSPSIFDHTVPCPKNCYD
ncbi:hypothetical protein [Flavobacterium saliperosum]|nr:hypothetical protein [Flavobacterium saliperosum]